ncbi:MAG: hypothetical protein R6W90_08720 [Ignavibacteriaceae bacterium]
MKSYLDFEKTLDMNSPEFPFKTSFSLKPLIELWEKESKHPNSLKSSIASKVVENLKNKPELYEPIEDLSVIDKYKETVDLLMSLVYAPSQWNIQISSSSIPFKFKSFYKTPSFERIFQSDEFVHSHDLGIDRKAMYRGKILSAYLAILDKFYNINARSSTPVIIKIKDNDTRVYKYYQFLVDISFTSVKCTGTLPVLNPEDIENLLKDPYNIDNWMETIPPDNFVFEGFVTYTAIDVTSQEAISALKFDLLEKESIISEERFRSLEDKLQSLFELPELRLGLASIPEDWSLFWDYGRKIGDSFLLNDSCKTSCESFVGSVYDKVERSGKTIIIEDIDKYEGCTAVENELKRQGIRNILIAPLFYKNKIIGVLELGSPNPGDINYFNWIKIKSVLMLFATAVKRSMEELDTQIQAVIKEECTAIHPSVEWRFRRAAVNLIFKKEKDKLAEMEDIVFENVYPLYGLSDIRNSSDSRNESIREDLLSHLSITQEIIKSANRAKNLPILKELVYSIEKNSKRLKKGLNSGDEISIIEFIQNEIEPLFNHIKTFGDDINSLILDYYKMLDPQLNTFYLKRKYYEESVTLINDTISKYLDECEKISQEMLPHYFEKYKTDGVEHGMYIGSSLLREEEFNQIYLKNLRLWQLMMICGIVRKTEEIKPQLRIPLETSHLILVQNKPLSIRFRQDDKKFDVDGTYNLRYEIMKKRIDKAFIKGTDERLTQPGKIAIIYSQKNEAAEYRRYLEYLESIGYIKERADDFELEDLQGVHGLRALRVTVNTKNVTHSVAGDINELSVVTQKMENVYN